MNKLKMTRLLLILFLCANISSYAQESSTFDDKHFVEYLTNSLKNNDLKDIFVFISLISNLLSLKNTVEFTVIAFTVKL